MRKALIVGIDYYTSASQLTGCVRDANAVSKMLERNADGSVNFITPRLITASDAASSLDRTRLKKAVRELFEDDAEIALFYFAGHGYIEDTGGFLCASDCKSGDDGFSLSELLSIANKSKAKNRIILLDSCHSGIVGSRPGDDSISEIKEGTTILTASTAEQYAAEDPDGQGGVFTNLLVDALGGAASNLLGEVSPGSVYAHIDQSLGPWTQRPLFKTNVRRFVSLRKAHPSIPLQSLRDLAKHFPSSNFKFQLDPTFEPERTDEQNLDPTFPKPNSENTAVFAVLQQYARVNLVRPIGAPHMWHAAMNGSSCELTVLGEHYRRLVAEGLI
jgi:hypothetical protein